MHRSGTVSVVITTFNRPELLPVAIESALGQTRPADEVIVVDEGDSARTRPVVERYPGVRYLWKEDDGLSGARNAGLRAASGDYINFLDDDDWFLPRKLEVQSALLDARPEIDLVYCRLQRATSPGQITGEYLQNHHPPADPVRALLRENYILAHAPLIRRQRLLEIGGFDVDNQSSEEYEGWLRLALTGARFHFCEEILAVVRVTPGSMSSNRARLIRKIETGFRKNGERLKPYRGPDGREWWLAGPAYLLGRAALAEGDAAAARSEFQRALEYDPGHRHARLYLGLTALPAPVRTALLRARGWKQAALRRLGPYFGLESRWG